MVNVHVIFREGYFVDCPPVSFCFAIPDSQKQFKGVDVEDLYCPVYSSASNMEFEDE
jgi:hypothetical protein